ncbi:unnamed protein product [Didymodactylos carnosus]|uniref:FLYWCH-type domain-containing protein n=1 Tax=Didymodactylos carnosus TaxID=1234261 RepID=A0A815FLT2_9BILA|nr:unnamed protein product [Didymodactylos carnosus]CAF4174122.1 unnamed protein product [Didymodactylos carnosus]
MSLSCATEDTSKDDHKSLLYKTYRYRFRTRKVDGTETWRCTDRNCCASTVVNQTTLAVLVERGNRAYEEVKVEHPLVQDLKRKVEDDISPIPHQYEGAIHQMNAAVEYVLL